jgi:hypothetical protein
VIELNIFLLIGAGIFIFAVGFGLGMILGQCVRCELEYEEKTKTIIG